MIPLTILREKLHHLRFKKESAIIQYVKEKHLTYCDKEKLEHIARSIRTIRKKGIPGIFIEAGVALGGSAIVIATLKDSATHFYLYDVFGMIPPPTEHDGSDAHMRYHVIASGKSEGIGKQPYYGYLSDVREKVIKNMNDAGIDLETSHIHLIEGSFDDTLMIAEQVAFAHIDADWYESVKICIDRISPHLSVGGIMIFDDYNSYSGCKKAVDEFLQHNRAFALMQHDKSVSISRTNNG